MKTAMMSLLPFLLLSLITITTVAFAEEEERDLLGCSADQLISCISEIESESTHIVSGALLMKKFTF